MFAIEKHTCSLCIRPILMDILKELYFNKADRLFISHGNLYVDVRGYFEASLLICNLYGHTVEGTFYKNIPIFFE